MKGPLAAADIAAGLASADQLVTEEQAGQLAAYLSLLEQWNRVHNLTGIRDRSTLIHRHLVESLALRPWITGPKAADIGSGGGLPGIPLAVCLPDIRFTLIESRRKRASFLRHVATTLKLANVDVAHARAEAVTSGPFDSVLARAVAPPADLLALSAGLVAPEGRLVLLTGEEKGRAIVALADGFAEIPANDMDAMLQSRIIVLERSPVS